MSDDVAVKGSGLSDGAQPRADGLTSPAEPAPRALLGFFLIVADLAGLCWAWLTMDVALHRWFAQTWNQAFSGSVIVVVAGMALLRFMGLHRARTCTMRSVELAKLGRVAASSAVAAY